MFAYLVTRTNMRCKKYLSSIFIFPYIMPQWTLAVIWQNLFDSNSSQAHIGRTARRAVRHKDAAVVVPGHVPQRDGLSLHYAPFAYILIGGIFLNMDATLSKQRPSWVLRG